MEESFERVIKWVGNLGIIELALKQFTTVISALATP